ncbi:sensor histidine kinase [Marinagarivorans algicola]|uniref:sensor histidine kinase n=1 Tax=Marinagarivorans algicola TaxID=1513270 RepID=UPI000A5967AF|nr:ATP-binding protein [Marinagarivorans algicola]
MTSFDNYLARTQQGMRRWVVICLTIIIVTGANIYYAFDVISDLAIKQRSVTNTNKIILALKDLHNALLLAESGQRGYLLTEDEEYLSHYHVAIDGLRVRVNNLLDLTTEIPDQQARIQNFIDLVKAKKQELMTTVNLAQTNREAEAVKILFTGQGHELYSKIYIAFREIESIELNMQDQLYADMAKSQKITKENITIASLISLCLIIFLLYLFQKNNRREGRYQQQLESQNKELENKVSERTLELTLYSDELSRSNRELEDFAFVASHDLQEPLRKIQAFADRIQRNYGEALDDKGRDYLERMNNAASRMSQLITDLLEFSRIKTRGNPFTDVALGDIIDQIFEDMEVSINESQATFSVSEMPKIHADSHQMYRLFMNLLSNAVKFRKHDSPPHISLSWSVEEQSVPASQMALTWHVIRLTDNGIGFSQEYADKIFLPFQRLHGRSEYKGTGIGLAICRRIVERHGGNITATSTVGQGTCFQIMLPTTTINFDDPIT